MLLQNNVDVALGFDCFCLSIESFDTVLSINHIRHLKIQIIHLNIMVYNPKGKHRS